MAAGELKNWLFNGPHHKNYKFVCRDWFCKEKV